MRISSLWRRSRQSSAAPAPQIIDGGDIDPVAPWSPPREGVREVRHYDVRLGGKRRQDGKRSKDRDVLSGGLLWVAGLIIAASLVGAGYVAYESQRLFALEHVSGADRQTRAAIIAALPDAGWGAMALVALVAALRGRSSARARLGVVVFFALSLGAQLMYAPRTPEGYLVAVIAPITLAWMLESFVVEVRRWAVNRRGLDLEEAPILTGVLRAVVAVPVLGWRLLLWWVRLAFDRRGTWRGVRDWVLDEAPLAPGRTAASLRAAAALEQADQVQAAAEQARAEALAEVAQIRAGAAEQVQAALAEAERARAEAAEQVEQIRAEAAERVAEAERAAGARAESARADVERQIERIRAEQEAAAERARSALAEERDRILSEKVSLEHAFKQLRAEHERLLAVAPAKARLIAAYERLGASGDPRYMDRDRVAEVARELYAAAGLQSEGTARTYLYEYVSEPAGSAVNGTHRGALA